jgi:predicted nucleic acid-binding protein
MNRPYDDLTQARVWYETLALSFILSLVEFNEARLLHSLIHDMENDRTKNDRRREWVKACLNWGAVKPPLDFTRAIYDRAQQLELLGVKTFDALHLASAEALNADAFLTYDDRLIRRYSGTMRVENPTTFIARL